eukprot:SAG25_NODE_29_length_20738_cov_25.829546_8_plen_454_part_00
MDMFSREALQRHIDVVPEGSPGPRPKFESNAFPTRTSTAAAADIFEAGGDDGTSLLDGAPWAPRSQPLAEMLSGAFSQLMDERLAPFKETLYAQDAVLREQERLVAQLVHEADAAAAEECHGEALLRGLVDWEEQVVPKMDLRRLEEYNQRLKEVRRVTDHGFVPETEVHKHAVHRDLAFDTFETFAADLGGSAPALQKQVAASFRRKYRSLCVNPARVFRELDTDHSGKIELDEFVDATHNALAGGQLSGISESDLTWLFCNVDRQTSDEDGDPMQGSIGLQDLATFIWAWEPSTRREVGEYVVTYHHRDRAAAEGAGAEGAGAGASAAEGGGGGGGVGQQRTPRVWCVCQSGDTGTTEPDWRAADPDRRGGGGGGGGPPISSPAAAAGGAGATIGLALELPTLVDGTVHWAPAAFDGDELHSARSAAAAAATAAAAAAGPPAADQTGATTT